MGTRRPASEPTQCDLIRKLSLRFAHQILALVWWVTLGREQCVVSSAWLVSGGG